MSAQSFFNKINQVSMNELIDFMVHNKIELSFKLQNRYVKTNIDTKKNTFFSLIRFNSPNLSSDLFQGLANEPVTCLFQVKEERYLFKSYLNINNLNCGIEIPTEIFQLQRRNDYRVVIPIGLIYSCEIVSINNVTAKLKAEIRNVSLGGCRLSISGNNLRIKQNDKFEMFLKMNKFEFQKIPLIARHLRPFELQNSLIIGASLLDPDSATLSELQSLLMFLDRAHRGKINE